MEIICPSLPTALPFLTQAADLFRAFEVEGPLTITVETAPDAAVTASLNGVVFRVLLRETSLEKTAKHAAYLALEALTGYSPPWGSLTGVKPAKKFDLLAQAAGEEAAADRLAGIYRVSQEKISLLKQVRCTQKRMLTDPLLPGDAVSLYVHIPLCPAKCSYCSFPSMATCEGSRLTEEYLEALLIEIEMSLDWANGRFPAAAVYFGGGTPAIFTPHQMNRLLSACQPFMKNAREISFEAGRADLITAEKLSVLKEHGIGRISLNLQSASDETLFALHRSITLNEFFHAADLIAQAVFDHMNCDIIIGLENEKQEQYTKSLLSALEAGADNITLHTLCAKNTAGTTRAQTAFVNKGVNEFLNHAGTMLSQQGFHPYYTYKQRYAIEGAENTGYAKKDADCLYNIITMGTDLTHILAAGAGAASRIAIPERTTSKGVYNLKNVELYQHSVEEVTRKKLKAMETALNERGYRL